VRRGVYNAERRQDYGVQRVWLAFEMKVRGATMQCDFSCATKVMQQGQIVVREFHNHYPLHGYVDKVHLSYLPHYSGMGADKIS
jgi:hypothetical protein